MSYQVQKINKNQLQVTNKCKNLNYRPWELRRLVLDFGHKEIISTFFGKAPLNLLVSMSLVMIYFIYSNISVNKSQN